MPTVPILVIAQRTEDGMIAVNTQIPDPLAVLELLCLAQKTIIQDARNKLEVKAESKLITGENGKAILT